MKHLGHAAAPEDVTGRKDAWWDEEVDVVVVGFGAAGAAAAIEAARAGARVLVVDRFGGGGATAMSGGVVYLGGGTHLQKAAGYADDTEQMYRYLRAEVGETVGEKTLRAFCDQSLDNLAFLEGIGVPLPARGEAPKTSYPPNDCTLYFSGNELCPPYDEQAKPAPRGHRVLGRGLTGNVLFRHLRRAVDASGASVRLHTRALRLVVDGDTDDAAAAGDDERAVAGIEIASVGPLWARLLHALLGRAQTLGGMMGDRIARVLRRGVEALEGRASVTRRVRAVKGVVLCAGGFVFNEQMLREFAPDYAGCMPLGTAGDDGAGIALGHGVDGALGEMHRCTAWRFINPPVALTRGLLVDRTGRRICNEELYGASLGERITEDCEGRAFLVIDARTRSSVLAEIRASRKLNFQNLSALVGLFASRVRANTLEELAARSGMAVDVLRATVNGYNERCAAGLPDEEGKSVRVYIPQNQAPFYALRLDSKRGAIRAPALTLGGLVTDPLSGRVLRDDGLPVPGLYAAGRNAVGVCSYGYVSGLSIADCIFAGRSAGRAVAANAAAGASQAERT